MEEMVNFLWQAVVFVTLPIYLFTRLVKWLKSDKPAGRWLFELAVILTILGILAAIAIPDFLKFQAKAKCSESATNLGALFTLQMKYHDKHGVYAGGPDAFMYLDWKPEGQAMYAYFCGEDYLPNTKSVRIGREHRPAITGSSATGFTCTAVGNIDNDPALDYWSMNDRKERKNEPSDLEH